MKKRAWLYAILIAVSGTLVTWLFLLENEGTTRPQLYDFTVEDTASVDRITIRDKRPMETVLTRTRDGWRVNGGYLARPDAIEILLETLKRQEMRSFAPEKAKKRVLNMMSTRGTEVIVEAEGEVVKHFYVGGNAPDLLGTYMMIRGSDGPYQVHIPGFNGFLNTRYFADPNMWRNRTLVSIDAENIERISLEYHHDPEAGYAIRQSPVGTVHVTSWPAGEKLVFDTAAVLGYLQEFRQTYFEGLITPRDRIWDKKDSILTSQPVFTLRVDGKDDRDTKLVAYYKSVLSRTTNTNEPLQYDQDRYYALLNGEDFILIQNYGMRKMLRERSYFQNTPVVKK